VWEKIKSWLTEPAQLIKELNEYRADKDNQNAPLRERLTVIDDLLTDNRQQLGRLLDLYLSGDFDKSILTERKARLETTVKALEKERTTLAASLEAQTLTDEQIATVFDFAAAIREGLEVADRDFDARRRIVEMLDVQVTLTIEDGVKAAWLSCTLLGKDEQVSIVSKDTRSHGQARRTWDILMATGRCGVVAAVRLPRGRESAKPMSPPPSPGVPIPPRPPLGRPTGSPPLQSRWRLSAPGCRATTSLSRPGSPVRSATARRECFATGQLAFYFRASFTLL